jgi:hypothetical protein
MGGGLIDSRVLFKDVYCKYPVFYFMSVIQETVVWLMVCVMVDGWWLLVDG